MGPLLVMEQMRSMPMATRWACANKKILIEDACPQGNAEDANLLQELVSTDMKDVK